MTQKKEIVCVMAIVVQFASHEKKFKHGTGTNLDPNYFGTLH